MADIYSQEGLKISGEITNIEFSSISGLTNGYWDIGLSLNSSNGQNFSISNKYAFKSGFDAITACNATADALAPAIQDLIKATISHPNFNKLLMGDTAIYNQEIVNRDSDPLEDELELLYQSNLSDLEKSNRHVELEKKYGRTCLKNCSVGIACGCSCINEKKQCHTAIPNKKSVTTPVTQPAPMYPSNYNSGTVNVKGYYRKDGTYVKPHTRRK